MYRANKQPRQKPLFSSLSDLPEKEKVRLSTSWAGTFYEVCFSRIDEAIFEILYSDKASRPNIAVNVLVGLEIMKSGFGWSDAELEDALHFNLQVRYALGYYNLDEGHFELRTLYNFRSRLVKHMQETGENLLEEVFEQLTDEQLERLKLKTQKLRVDSTQIASNIRQMSRVQLLVEVLQRVWRMLRSADQANYQGQFEPYLKGSSGQYVYPIKPDETVRHLTAIGALLQELVGALRADYHIEAAYQVLARVFEEHFVLETERLRAKVGAELRADSLQSPDDWQASYRKKQGQAHRGYVSNITETCATENPVQLIVKVQTVANKRDDAQLLAEALPNLVARTAVTAFYTDGNYGSPEVDAALAVEGIELYQTAIRGRNTAPGRLDLADFEFTLDPAARPIAVKCPHGQQLAVQVARQSERFSARFDADICATCPLLERCPSEALRRQPQRVLRFNQQQVNVARRRQKQKLVRAADKNLRSAVEATVRSLKHPFGNGKLPVRGQPRMSMMMIASAAMTNVRRIWRSQVAKNEQLQSKTALNQVSPLAAGTFLRPFFRFFATASCCSLRAA